MGHFLSSTRSSGCRKNPVRSTTRPTRPTDRPTPLGKTKAVRSSPSGQGSWSAKASNHRTGSTEKKTDSIPSDRVYRLGYSSPAMESFVGIVLSLLLAPTLANPHSLVGTEAVCRKKLGIGLGWLEPFSFCGVLVVFVEVLSEHPPNYFPLTQNGHYMKACASADQQQVHLQFEWCSNISEPALMLPMHIHQLDMRVLKHNDVYKFYGCSVKFQTMFDIAMYETRLHQLSCRSLMAYVGQRSELHGTYELHTGAYINDKPSPQSRDTTATILGVCWFIVLFAICSLMYLSLTMTYDR
uniref:Uncharacterized protein n=1 Tax=Anopheles atroparvus TaxID=41427 RepID=A0A182J937_ANOAO